MDLSRASILDEDDANADADADSLAEPRLSSGALDEVDSVEEARRRLELVPVLRDQNADLLRLWERDRARCAAMSQDLAQAQLEVQRMRTERDCALAWETVHGLAVDILRKKNAEEVVKLAQEATLAVLGAETAEVVRCDGKSEESAHVKYVAQSGEWLEKDGWSFLPVQALDEGGKVAAVVKVKGALPSGTRREQAEVLLQRVAEAMHACVLEEIKEETLAAAEEALKRLKKRLKDAQGTKKKMERFMQMIGNGAVGKEEDGNEGVEREENIARFVENALGECLELDFVRFAVGECGRRTVPQGLRTHAVEIAVEIKGRKERGDVILADARGEVSQDTVDLARLIVVHSFSCFDLFDASQRNERTAAASQAEFERLRSDSARLDNELSNATNMLKQSEGLYEVMDLILSCASFDSLQETVQVRVPELLGGCKRCTINFSPSGSAVSSVSRRRFSTSWVQRMEYNGLNVTLEIDAPDEEPFSPSNEQSFQKLSKFIQIKLTELQKLDSLKDEIDLTRKKLTDAEVEFNRAVLRSEETSKRSDRLQHFTAKLQCELLALLTSDASNKIELACEVATDIAMEIVCLESDLSPKHFVISVLLCDDLLECFQKPCRIEEHSRNTGGHRKFLEVITPKEKRGEKIICEVGIAGRVVASGKTSWADAHAVRQLGFLTEWSERELGKIVVVPIKSNSSTTVGCIQIGSIANVGKNLESEAGPDIFLNRVDLIETLGAALHSVLLTLTEVQKMHLELEQAEMLANKLEIVSKSTDELLDCENEEEIANVLVQIVSIDGAPEGKLADIHMLQSPTKKELAASSPRSPVISRGRRLANLVWDGDTSTSRERKFVSQLLQCVVPILLERITLLSKARTNEEDLAALTSIEETSHSFLRTMEFALLGMQQNSTVTLPVLLKQGFNIFFQGRFDMEFYESGDADHNLAAEIRPVLEDGVIVEKGDTVYFPIHSVEPRFHTCGVIVVSTRNKGDTIDPLHISVGGFLSKCLPIVHATRSNFLEMDSCLQRASQSLEEVQQSCEVAKTGASILNAFLEGVSIALDSTAELEHFEQVACESINSCLLGVGTCKLSTTFREAPSESGGDSCQNTKLCIVLDKSEISETQEINNICKGISNTFSAMSQLTNLTSMLKKQCLVQEEKVEELELELLKKSETFVLLSEQLQALSLMGDNIDSQLPFVEKVRKLSRHVVKIAAKYSETDGVFILPQSLDLDTINLGILTALINGPTTRYWKDDIESIDPIIRFLHNEVSVEKILSLFTVACQSTHCIVCFVNPPDGWVPRGFDEALNVRIKQLTEMFWALEESRAKLVDTKQKLAETDDSLMLKSEQYLAKEKELCMLERIATLFSKRIVRATGISSLINNEFAEAVGCSSCIAYMGDSTDKIIAELNGNIISRISIGSGVIGTSFGSQAMTFCLCSVEDPVFDASVDIQACQSKEAPRSIACLPFEIGPVSSLKRGVLVLYNPPDLLFRQTTFAVHFLAFLGPFLELVEKSRNMSVELEKVTSLSKVLEQKALESEIEQSGLEKHAELLSNQVDAWKEAYSVSRSLLLSDAFPSSEISIEFDQNYTLSEVDSLPPLRGSERESDYGNERHIACFVTSPPGSPKAAKTRSDTQIYSANHNITESDLSLKSFYQTCHHTVRLLVDRLEIKEAAIFHHAKVGTSPNHLPVKLTRVDCGATAIPQVVDLDDSGMGILPGLVKLAFNSEQECEQLFFDEVSRSPLFSRDIDNLEPSNSAFYLMYNSPCDVVVVFGWRPHKPFSATEKEGALALSNQLNLVIMAQLSRTRLISKLSLVTIERNNLTSTESVLQDRLESVSNKLHQLTKSHDADKSLLKFSAALCNTISGGQNIISRVVHQLLCDVLRPSIPGVDFAFLYVVSPGKGLVAWSEKEKGRMPCQVLEYVFTTAQMVRSRQRLSIAVQGNSSDGILGVLDIHCSAGSNGFGNEATKVPNRTLRICIDLICSALVSARKIDSITEEQAHAGAFEGELHAKINELQTRLKEKDNIIAESKLEAANRCNVILESLVQIQSYANSVGFNSEELLEGVQQCLCTLLQSRHVYILSVESALREPLGPEADSSLLPIQPLGGPTVAFLRLPQSCLSIWPQKLLETILKIIGGVLHSNQIIHQNNAESEVTRKRIEALTCEKDKLLEEGEKNGLKLSNGLSLQRFLGQLVGCPSILRLKDLVRESLGQCFGMRDLVDCEAEISFWTDGQFPKSRVDCGISGFVSRTGHPVVLAGIREDPRFHPDYDTKLVNGRASESLLCGPLVNHSKGEVFGMLRVFVREKSPHFADEITSALADLCKILESFAERTLKEEALKTTVDNVQRHDVALREEIRMLRANELKCSAITLISSSVSNLSIEADHFGKQFALELQKICRGAVNAQAATLLVIEDLKQRVWALSSDGKRVPVSPDIITTLTNSNSLHQLAQAVSTKQPQVWSVSDGARVGRFPYLSEVYSVESAAFIPITDGTKSQAVVGLLQVMNKLSDGGTLSSEGFTGDDIELLRVLACHLGILVRGRLSQINKDAAVNHLKAELSRTKQVALQMKNDSSAASQRIAELEGKVNVQREILLGKVDEKGKVDKLIENLSKKAATLEVDCEKWQQKVNSSVDLLRQAESVNAELAHQVSRLREENKTLLSTIGRAKLRSRDVEQNALEVLRSAKESQEEVRYREKRTEHLLREKQREVEQKFASEILNLQLKLDQGEIEHKRKLQQLEIELSRTKETADAAKQELFNAQHRAEILEKENSKLLEDLRLSMTGGAFVSPSLRLYSDNNSGEGKGTKPNRKNGLVARSHNKDSDDQGGYSSCGESEDSEREELEVRTETASREKGRKYTGEGRKGQREEAVTRVRVRDRDSHRKIRGESVTSTSNASGHSAATSVGMEELKLVCDQMRLSQEKRTESLKKLIELERRQIATEKNKSNKTVPRLESIKVVPWKTISRAAASKGR